VSVLVPSLHTSTFPAAALIRSAPAQWFGKTSLQPRLTGRQPPRSQTICPDACGRSTLVSGLGRAGRSSRSRLAAGVSCRRAFFTFVVAVEERVGPAGDLDAAVAVVPGAALADQRTDPRGVLSLMASQRIDACEFDIQSGCRRSC